MEVGEIGVGIAVALLGIHLVLCIFPLLVLSLVLITLKLLLTLITLKLLPRQHHLSKDHPVTISIFLVGDGGPGYR